MALTEVEHDSEEQPVIVGVVYVKPKDIAV
jgi:hypothetical protein